MTRILTFRDTPIHSLQGFRRDCCSIFTGSLQREQIIVPSIIFTAFRQLTEARKIVVVVETVSGSEIREDIQLSATTW